MLFHISAWKSVFFFFNFFFLTARLYKALGRVVFTVIKSVMPKRRKYTRIRFGLANYLFRLYFFHHGEQLISRKKTQIK